MSATRRSVLRFGSTASEGRAPEAGAPISLGRAVEIARTAGLVRATEAACDADGWDIEGFDASGREIEVAIHPTSGRVLRIARQA